jgi:FMN phosphatase YigB (HAD superfamily)
MLIFPTDRGLLIDIKDAVFGQSKEHAEEDSAIRQAHFARVQKMQDEALERARQQREYQRRLAAERVEKARVYEEKMGLQLSKCQEEMIDSNYQLEAAKASLGKAAKEMELLGNKKLELVTLTDFVRPKHSC